MEQLRLHGCSSSTSRQKYAKHGLNYGHTRKIFRHRNLHWKCVNLKTSWHVREFAHFTRVCTFITYTYEATEVADATLAPNYKRVRTSLPEGVDPTKPLRELPRLQFVPARPQLRLSQTPLRCQPAPVGDGAVPRGEVVPGTAWPSNLGFLTNFASQVLVEMSLTSAALIRTSIKVIMNHQRKSFKPSDHQRKTTRPSGIVYRSWHDFTLR